MRSPIALTVLSLFFVASLSVEAQTSPGSKKETKTPAKTAAKSHAPSEQEYALLAKYHELDGILQSLDMKSGRVVVRILDEHIVLKNVNVSTAFGASADVGVSKHYYDFNLKLKENATLRKMWETDGKAKALTDAEKIKLIGANQGNPGYVATASDLRPGTHVKIRLDHPLNQHAVVTLVLGMDPKAKKK